MGAGKVSVMVIFGRGEFEPCLSSLLVQEYENFEIIAVLPDEGLAEKLPPDSRIKWLTEKDSNPALRRNRAAKTAQGSILAFIDDDAHAPPDWLQRGVEFLEADAGYQGVGGPNLIPGEASAAERITDVLLTTPLIGAGSRAYRGGGQRAQAKPGEVHLVNFMVEKGIFERVGGFNEKLGYGGEDTEFIHQAGLAGAKFAFDPGLIVYHRRRPFGLSYVIQRFRLRTQSGRLFAAHPDIYKDNFGLMAALASPALVGALAWIAAFLMGGSGVVLLAFFYAILVMGLSLRTVHGRSALLVLMPLAFLVHHAVYAAGLWWGLLDAILKGPSRIRRGP